MELRLSDGMPDMGNVLGCWGQVLLRGKEWHDTSASANGGVMVWVLYAPEDGTEPRVVEGWIPVQNRWEFPEESRDGMLTVYPWLSGLDGRNISARKLMLRAEVSMMGSGRKPWKAELSVPADLPTDIQILKKTYGRIAVIVLLTVTMFVSRGYFIKCYNYFLQCFLHSFVKSI